MGRNFDPDKIAEALSTLDVHDYGDVLQCMRCGLCLPTCPTYRTDGVETQSPRGRVALIKAVIDGKMKASEEFVEHIYHCLDCRNCQTVCPAGVKAGELALEARYRIEQNRPQPLIKKFLLNYAILDQKRLAKLLTPLKIYQISGLQSLVRRYDILKLISEDLRFMEALTPKLPSRPLSEDLPEEIPALGRERGRVGFFLGCAMNLIFAETSRATIENLTRAGFKVIVPKEIQCCGTPNIAEGERKIYREMAENTIKIFTDRRVDYVVTDCAACGSELKAYRDFFHKKSNFASRAEEFSRKVRDVSEFLDSVWSPDIKLGPIPEIVCFHDPCHLRHGQKLLSPQRNLLKRIPDLDYRELPDEGQCCGSAGIYNITHRNRSMKILQSKIEAIGKTQAKTVVSSNPGCLMQLAYGSKMFGRGWDVIHISEILNRSLRSAEEAN
ncbi:MAG: (Fe-S)-binding protein [Desulfomonilaceae bacterium]